jgi:hypothetical protein
MSVILVLLESGAAGLSHLSHSSQGQIAHVSDFVAQAVRQSGFAVRMNLGPDIFEDAFEVVSPRPVG